MAKKGDRPKEECDFQITAPPQPDSAHPEKDVCVADNGSVLVSILETVGGCDGFTGTISGTGVSSSQTLSNTPGTNVWSAQLSVGVFTDTAPGTANRSVTVTATDGPSYTQGFRAVHPGSCSGSSGSGSDDVLAAAALAKVFQEGRPAPVSVSAEFGAPPKPGGGSARVETATLVYSGAPGFERCWFSQPLDLRSDGADPALWMLERTDARTWLLRLRRGGFDLVVYRHTAAVEKDGSLPVRLYVEGDGNGASAEWPLTVTISPAP